MTDRDPKAAYGATPPVVQAPVATTGGTAESYVEENPSSHPSASDSRHSFVVGSPVYWEASDGTSLSGAVTHVIPPGMIITRPLVGLPDVDAGSFYVSASLLWALINGESRNHPSYIVSTPRGVVARAGGVQLAAPVYDWPPVDRLKPYKY